MNVTLLLLGPHLDVHFSLPFLTLLFTFKILSIDSATNLYVVRINDCKPKADIIVP